jgi:small subunit ribosomal protein S20
MGEVKAIARLTLRDFSPNFQGFGAGHSRPAHFTLGSASNEVVVPRIKSAAKRMRQARSRTKVNRSQRSELRSALRKVRAAAGDAAKQAYDEAVTLLDRAGRKRIIHPNAAARQKSRLAKLLGKK